MIYLTNLFSEIIRMDSAFQNTIAQVEFQEGYSSGIFSNEQISISEIESFL